jgi:hypothetical protein
MNNDMNASNYQNINEIRQDIFRFRNDKDTLRLEHFYNAPSYAEILGVSRKELNHSNFLAWVLNSEESHSLNYFPIKKLLEIVVQHSPDKHQIVYSDLYNAIVTDDILITAQNIEREKHLNDAGILDLYIELTVIYFDKEITLRLVIENKVKSKEHSDQTIKYFKHFENIRNNDDINLYVFLTPISGIDLVELSEPECSCKEFVQINYQALADSMFQPILNTNLSDKNKMIIEDYLQSLSQPSFDIDTDFKQELIMAIGTEERELLKKFWTKNQKLILTALSAISSDPDQEKDERDSIKDAISKISNSAKDRSLYSIHYNNQNEVSKIKKSDIGLETVNILDKHGLIDDETFEFLREDKSCSFLLLKKKEEVRPTEEQYGKYRVNKAPEIVFLEQEYYVARNWGLKNTEKFIKKMCKKFPLLRYELHK